MRSILCAGGLGLGLEIPPSTYVLALDLGLGGVDLGMLWKATIYLLPTGILIFY